jgi:hypothetical protein
MEFKIARNGYEFGRDFCYRMIATALRAAIKIYLMGENHAVRRTAL